MYQNKSNPNWPVRPPKQRNPLAPLRTSAHWTQSSAAWPTTDPTAHWVRSIPVHSVLWSWTDTSILVPVRSTSAPERYTVPVQIWPSVASPSSGARRGSRWWLSHHWKAISPSGYQRRPAGHLPLLGWGSVCPEVRAVLATATWKQACDVRRRAYDGLARTSPSRIAGMLPRATWELRRFPVNVFVLDLARVSFFFFVGDYNCERTDLRFAFIHLLNQRRRIYIVLLKHLVCHVMWKQI